MIQNYQLLKYKDKSLPKVQRLLAIFYPVAPKEVASACETCNQRHERGLKTPARYNNSKTLIYLSDQ